MLRMIVILLVTLPFAMGCTSIRSIMLHRNEWNTAWEQERHLPGVPITLKVPTHLKVAVIEKHYLTVTNVGGVEQVERVSVPVPLRDVTTEFLYTDKIFTVDFKRPAAGRMNMTLDFQDDQQYFEQIQHEVVDETIKDVTALVASIAPGGLFTPASAGGAEVEAKVKEVNSIVAIQVFEIDAPDFELQLSQFLHCHLNQAHDAWVMPPGVNQIKRLPLTDDHFPPVQLCPGNCPTPPFPRVESEVQVEKPQQYPLTTPTSS